VCAHVLLPYDASEVCFKCLRPAAYNLGIGCCWADLGNLQTHGNRIICDMELAGMQVQHITFVAGCWFNGSGTFTACAASASTIAYVHTAQASAAAVADAGVPVGQSHNIAAGAAAATTPAAAPSPAYLLVVALLLLALLLLEPLLLPRTLAITMLPGSGTTGAAPLATTCTTACQDSSRNTACYMRTATLNRRHMLEHIKGAPAALRRRCAQCYSMNSHASSKHRVLHLRNTCMLYVSHSCLLAAALLGTVCGCRQTTRP
jgi:hypothetical protein